MTESFRVRRSLTRSRVRVRLLFALLHLRRAYLAELAREANVAPCRAHDALVGDGETYATEDSLVALGLVEIEESRAIVVRLTSAGERAAREWRSASASTLFARSRRAPA